MIKVIPSGSFDFGVPAVSLMDVWSRGVDKSYMQKRAAVLTREIGDIKPEPGHSFIHLISLGAYDFYSGNRNGDAWFEKAGSVEIPEPKKGVSKLVKLGGGLTETHPTFKNGHLFKHHQNTDPSKAIGKIAAEAYNPTMHRGELVVKVANDHPDWKDELEKLANGKDIPFSMACITDPAYPVRGLEGYKKISEIVVGDCVHTHLNNWKKVTAIHRRVYTGKLYTFEMNGLPFPLEMTADHPMWAKLFVGSREVAAVNNKSRRYFSNKEEFDKQPAGWSHAEHVQEGDRFFYQPITRIPGYGAIDDTRLASLMGYYTAEGSLSYNGEQARCVSYTCHMDDTLPRRVPKIMQELYPEITVGIRPHACSAVSLAVDIHSTDFAEFMWKYLGRHADKKTICPELFNANDDVKLAYLGAWMDGDGFSDQKGVHWSSCNAWLVMQGRDLLASIGIPSSIYKIDHAKCETSGYENSGMEYTLNVSHIDAERLYPWSEKARQGSVFTPARRKPASMRACPDGRYAYRIKAVTVREVVDCPTFNLEVEDDNSYLLSGVISHNCKLPEDLCSWCGNRAKNRGEYCSHLRDNMTEITKTGHQIFAYNDNCSFFDISKVHRPADRIAYSLRKVAGAEPCGLDLAEEFGIKDPSWLDEAILSPSRNYRYKVAAARKLAEMEKMIDSVAQAKDNPQLKALACGAPKDIDSGTMDSLKKVKLLDALEALGSAQICLSVRDFFDLVLSNKSPEAMDEMPAVERMLPDLFSRICDSGDLSECASDQSYDTSGSAVPHSLKSILEKTLGKSSMSVAPTRHRISIAILSGDIPSFREPVKFAALNKKADILAKEYAKYLLSYSTQTGCGELDRGLTVARNRLTV